MTTEKQIAANRQNAKNSTGPRTEYGKRRSRRNAIRHGLTAETVIDVLEDPAVYKALQRAIYADYRPRSNFELQLVARLVSLLWRLRRAVAIESGLLNIHAGILRKRKHPKALARESLDIFYTVSPSISPAAQSNTDQQREVPIETAHSGIARSFLRLASIDSGVFDRLGRYEMSLWRQTVQIVLLLNSVNRGANEYADTENKYLQLRHLAGRRRRAVWPPFAISD